VIDVTPAGTVQVPVAGATVTVCPAIVPTTNNKTATTPTVRRTNFFNKLSLEVVADERFKPLLDEVFRLSKNEYNDFMPVAIKLFFDQGNFQSEWNTIQIRNSPN